MVYVQPLFTDLGLTNEEMFSTPASFTSQKSSILFLQTKKPGALSDD